MILPRQDNTSSTRSGGGPPDPTLLPTPHDSLDNGHTLLTPWQIGVTVIGGLFLIGIGLTLFLHFRTRRAIRRGQSTTKFDLNSVIPGNPNSLPYDHPADPSSSPDGRKVLGRLDSAPNSATGLNRPADGDNNNSNRPNATTERAAGMSRRSSSALSDLEVRIRRILQKTRVRGPSTSSSYPSGSAPSTERGHGRVKKKNTKRRKSQNGLDVRIRSADDHDHADYYDRDGGFHQEVEMMEAKSPNSKGNATGTAADGFQDIYAYGGAGSRAGPLVQEYRRPSTRDDHGTTAAAAAAAATSAPPTAFVAGSPSDAVLSSSAGHGGAGGSAWRHYDDYWGYGGTGGDDSVAHTIRGSFDDDEDEEEDVVRQQQQQHQRSGIDAAAVSARLRGVQEPG